jgi:hypothetical protein
MGNIISATCKCGLESEEIFQGIGFNYYSNHVRIEPAYCDQCGIVVGRDMCKSFSKCPKCRMKMKFYYEVLGTKNDEGDDTPSSEYLESQDLWHCPRCNEETLSFNFMGCWD